MKKLLISIFGITILIIVLLIISGFIKTNNKTPSPNVSVSTESGETVNLSTIPTASEITQPKLIRENPVKVWMQKD